MNYVLDKYCAKVSGEQMITPEDAVRLGLDYVPKMFRRIPRENFVDAPPRENILVVAYPGISIVELSSQFERMLGRKDRRGFLYNLHEAWYRSWPFAQEVHPAGWYQIILGDCIDDHLAIISYALIIHCLKTEKKLLEGKFFPYPKVRDSFGKVLCLQFHNSGLYLTWDPTIQIAGV